eukprot:3937371-Rhodomonas_salina.1
MARRHRPKAAPARVQDPKSNSNSKASQRTLFAPGTASRSSAGPPGRSKACPASPARKALGTVRPLRRAERSASGAAPAEHDVRACAVQQHDVRHRLGALRRSTHLGIERSAAVLRHAPAQIFGGVWKILRLATRQGAEARKRHCRSSLRVDVLKLPLKDWLGSAPFLLGPALPAFAGVFLESRSQTEGKCALLKHAAKGAALRATRKVQADTVETDTRDARGKLEHTKALAGRAAG